MKPVNVCEGQAVRESFSEAPVESSCKCRYFGTGGKNFTVDMWDLYGRSLLKRYAHAAESDGATPQTSPEPYPKSENIRVET